MGVRASVQNESCHSMKGDIELFEPNTYLAENKNLDRLSESERSKEKGKMGEE